jgi:hypothetical protein
MSERRCIGGGLVVEPVFDGSWDVYGAGGGNPFGYVRLHIIVESIWMYTFHPSFGVSFYTYPQMEAIAKFLRELEANLLEKST